MECLLGAGIASMLHGHYGAKNEGDIVWLMCRWEFGDFYIHIHHWLWYTLILFISLVYPLPFGFFIYGWCVAGIIDGLQFRDWYCICGSTKKLKSVIDE